MPEINVKAVLKAQKNCSHNYELRIPQETKPKRKSRNGFLWDSGNYFTPTMSSYQIKNHREDKRVRFCPRCGFDFKGEING